MPPCVDAQLFSPPWTIVHQAPLSMRFPRQEYWSGLPFPTPEDLPNPGIESACSCTEPPALRLDSLLLSHWGSPLFYYTPLQKLKVKSKVYSLENSLEISEVLSGYSLPEFSPSVETSITPLWNSYASCPDKVSYSSPFVTIGYYDTLTSAIYCQKYNKVCEPFDSCPGQGF